jgi:hypothetical protein
VIVSASDFENWAEISWPPATGDSVQELSTVTVCAGEQVVFGVPRVAKSVAQTCSVLEPSWNG